MSRTETDSLGQRELPDDVLYGINTLRGVENFNISSHKICDEPALVNMLVAIKKSAAKANIEVGAIDPLIGAAIISACEEIRAGQHQNQFIVNMLEGSGGTSINMNANEVIANRALQIIGHVPGEYDFIHPNDHVNAGQSTNDVVPSAVKLAVHTKSAALIRALTGLGDALEKRAVEFAHILKIGRTCMQAAQPMTLGQELSGYASAVHRARSKLDIAVRDMLTLPLGGTAIGTGFGSKAGYRDAVYRHLSAELDLPVKPADNMFDGMQNSDGFARVSSELRIAAEILGKISLDLIILSSGEQSGIGEIQLPPVQPGSSIMPGKVNPVLPMMIQQISYAVIGNDASVSLASLGGQLEINHFEPVIASRMFDSIDLLTRGSLLFSDRCIAGIKAMEENALSNLMASSALATAFVPVLGYRKVSQIVKDAEAEGKPFVDTVVGLGLMSRDEVIQALHAAACGTSEWKLASTDGNASMKPRRSEQRP